MWGSGFLLQHLLHVPRQEDLFLALSAPGVGEGSTNGKEEETVLHRQGGRLLLFGVSAEMNSSPALAAKLKMNP